MVGAPEVEGIERAVFGPRTADEVDRWLDRLVRATLSADLRRILFRRGRISAVYGVELAGGERVVVKVHRGHPSMPSLAAAVACQNRLAVLGYPAPLPLVGPTESDGRVAVIETLLESGSPADGHDPIVRTALADSLAEQIHLLAREVDPAGGAGLGAGLTVRPAWAVYDHGPWPLPHDPIFDFTTTAPGYGWLADFAREAADELVRARLPRTVGHGDWGTGNVLLSDGRVSAAFDWDSLMSDSEPVIVGLAAGSFTSGSAPSPDEIGSFLADYDRNRRRGDRIDRAVAVNAAAWVLAYNARCELAFTGADEPPRPGSSLAALRDHRREYRALVR